ncbi:MAG: CPBP family intramembrane metalloprotease [Lachnospiraceae bacterium]|nr:CPBP family intramembrane metalloprotease [Lachnospiraceae bacterium]
MDGKSGTKLKILKHIIIYLLLFLAGDLLNSLCFDLVFSIVKIPIRELYSILRMAGNLFITYLLFWLYTTKVLHQNMKDFRITFAIKKWGILFAICLPIFVVVIFGLIGNIVVNKFSFGKILFILIAALFMAVKAGILEEMLFRGFIMKLLEDKWNKYVAVFLPSFLFSLLHIPSMETFSIGGIMLLVVSGTLVGVMFSVVTYKGDSISNSALLHAVWNFLIITDILHITTVKGVYGAPIIAITIPSDNMLLTGGGFGIEASIIAIIGYSIICYFALFQKK